VPLRRVHAITPLSPTPTSEIDENSGGAGTSNQPIPGLCTSPVPMADSLLALQGGDEAQAALQRR